MKGCNEVIGWLQQLKGRENQLSQDIGVLQRELNMVALVNPRVWWALILKCRWA
jgi:hypothetical protein